MAKQHIFYLPLEKELAEAVKIRAVKAGRSFTAELQRAVRAYYKRKVKS
jgi:plasmid stability protein